MQGIYNNRQHFISKLTVAVVAWSVMVMCREAALDISGFHWHWVFFSKGYLAGYFADKY